jgi:uncharacterized protein with GYD domain
MPTFITTLRFTAQGLQNIRETTKRAAAFKASAKKIGVKVQGAYWTLGRNDGLLIFDAPDEETATAAMLGLSAEGNVHTETARAYGAAEMDKMLVQLKT